MKTKMVVLLCCLLVAATAACRADSSRGADAAEAEVNAADPLGSVGEPDEEPGQCVGNEEPARLTIDETSENTPDASPLRKYKISLKNETGKVVFLSAEYDSYDSAEDAWFRIQSEELSTKVQPASDDTFGFQVIAVKDGTVLGSSAEDYDSESSAESAAKRVVQLIRCMPSG